MMKRQIRRWFGYCLEGLVLLSAAGWGLVGNSRWDELWEAESMNHD